MSHSPHPHCPLGDTSNPGPLLAENGDDDENDLGDNGEDLGDDDDALHLERFMRDRRRAKSLPAYPEQVSLLGGVNSPDGRKRVKFADTMGMDLASVKHFSSLDEPRVPSKVLSRLRSYPPPPQPREEHLDDLCASFQSRLAAGGLVACFPPPGDDAGFSETVRQRRVALERVTVTNLEVRGHIRVLAAGCPRKEVGVRYTFNDWLSNVDAQALPVPADGEDSGVGERFSFNMYTPPCMEPSSSVHFAVYMRSSEGEFWDNNDGQNYVLRYRGVPGLTAFTSAAFNAT